MDACAELLALAQSGRIQLAVPAFALVEPLWTVPYRASKNEKEVKTQLSALRDIERHRTLGTEARRLGEDLNTLLVLHNQAAETNLKQRHSGVLDAATVLPTTAETLREASLVVAQLAVTSYFDALMLSSVLLHLRERKQAEPSYFLNANVNDFNTPDVRAALRKHGCEFIGSFRGGLARIRAALGT